MTALIVIMMVMSGVALMSGMALMVMIGLAFSSKERRVYWNEEVTNLLVISILIAGTASLMLLVLPV